MVTYKRAAAAEHGLIVGQRVEPKPFDHRQRELAQSSSR